MSADLKLDKAVSFTNREIKTLIAWEAAANAGDVGTAGRILSTGLLAEHYESLLDEDVTKRTPDQVATLTKLSSIADAAAAAVPVPGGGYPHA